MSHVLVSEMFSVGDLVGYGGALLDVEECNVVIYVNSIVFGDHSRAVACCQACAEIKMWSDDDQVL